MKTTYQESPYSVPKNIRKKYDDICTLMSNTLESLPDPNSIPYLLGTRIYDNGNQNYVTKKHCCKIVFHDTFVDH
jgi:hypothetical protein